jgi:HK97 family phage prohead protease
MTLKMKRQGIEYEIKSIDEKGYFEGYGNVKYYKDHAMDITINGAFQRSMDQHTANGTMPMMFWNHDNQGLQIGEWLEMREDEHGLFVRGQLFINDIQLAKEVYFLMKKGLVNSLSIGYFTIKEEWNQELQANILIDVELVECSPVNFACNDQSLIEVVKSKFNEKELPTKVEMEKALRELGLSRKQAKAFLVEGYKSFTQEDIKDLEAEALAQIQQDELALNKHIEQQKGLNEVLALINKLKQ